MNKETRYFLTLLTLVVSFVVLAKQVDCHARPGAHRHAQGNDRSPSERDVGDDPVCAKGQTTYPAHSA